MFGGRLVSRRGEVLIAPAASAAARDHERIARGCEIVEQFACRLVVDQRPDRNGQLDGMSLAAGLVAAFAVTAALGLVLGIKTEMEQRVVVVARFHDDVAAAAAVAAARTSPRNEFLATERETAVAAVAGLHENSDFVYEHVAQALSLSRLRTDCRAARVSKRSLVNSSDAGLYASVRMEMKFPWRPRSRNSTMPGTLANRVSSLPRPTFSPGLNRVPRCLTRMEPPVTVWPPNAFTPNRCAFESRPFLELPKPFLCAMSNSLRSGADLVDLQLCVVVPVADGALVLLLALELEYDHFGAAVMAENGGRNLGAAQVRTGHQFVGIAHQGEHTAQFDLRPNLVRKRIDPNFVSGGDAILLAAGFNHCVHNDPCILRYGLCGLVWNRFWGRNL